MEQSFSCKCVFEIQRCSGKVILQCGSHECLAKTARIENSNLNISLLTYLPLFLRSFFYFCYILNVLSKRFRPSWHLIEFVAMAWRKTNSCGKWQPLGKMVRGQWWFEVPQSILYLFWMVGMLPFQTVQSKNVWKFGVIINKYPKTILVSMNVWTVGTFLGPNSL